MDKLPGSFWFCHYCGKISLTKTGFDTNDNFVAERGWDVSCMLNCSEIMTSTVHEPAFLERLNKLGSVAQLVEAAVSKAVK